jgi:3',5'-cyclic AMP phosphodiesterase CpdA
LGTGTFQTAKGAGANDFSFLIFGDSGQGTSAQKAMASVMKQLNFSFAIHTGDVVYEGGYDSEFDSGYFTPYKSLIDHLPFFPVVGNHDLVADQGATFKENFFHPEGDLYYDFHWGDTHFIALNSTYSDRSAQRTWLEKTLVASTGRWKIVYFHHPPYNSGMFGNNPNIQRDFVPILEKYHVDVVFTGHAHSYERTFPINQITYFVTGGGGGGLTPVSQSDFTAYSGSRYHLLLAEMTPQTLTIKAIDRNGAVFDSVAISKSE